MIMQPVVFFLFIAMSALTKGWWKPKEVCYPKYGCFKKSTAFVRRFVKLPQDPSIIETKFHLFTTSSNQQSTLIDDKNKAKLDASNFEISKRTIFVIHGFTENIATSASWTQRMKTALLKREDLNIILVDWSKGAKGPDYLQASGNARLVGAQTAELIKFLISNAVGSSGSEKLGKRFYIVGFSLGAHVAGYAGSYLQANGIKLGRITGLDPAGPLHINVNPAFRLDKSDADKVDVIHTDTERAGTKREETVGHIDFFPNGGDKQPGCLDLEISCDHTRAPEYYIASVHVNNQCSFKARPCNSYEDCRNGNCLKCSTGGCPSMGFDADHAKHTGRFYLKTNSKAPFCGIPLTDNCVTAL